MAGVMRSHLMQQMKSSGVNLKEGVFTIADLEKADEIFLTNAFYGIRWVKRFGNKNYGFDQSARFFQEFVKPLFPELL